MSAVRASLLLDHSSIPCVNTVCLQGNIVEYYYLRARLNMQFKFMTDKLTPRNKYDILRFLNTSK